MREPCIPVRKVVRRSPVRVVGYHASMKMGALIPWESQIERDFFKWMEVDPEVTAFFSQPRRFSFGSVTYTPDAYIETPDGSFYVEVKDDEALFDVEQMNKLKFVSSHLMSQGIDFRIALSSVIREIELIKNVSILNRHVRRKVVLSASDLSEVQKIKNYAHQYLIDDFLAGIAQGAISADLRQGSEFENWLVSPTIGGNNYGAREILPKSEIYI